jgi:Tol biopolymer transport system component
MLIAIVSVLTFGVTAGLGQQSGYDLYQKALVKERAEGNIEGAIQLYQRIVREHGENRALAAKAQLRLGLLYERLGRKAEAQRAFQAVVSQYADQAEVARQAQAKMTANAQAKTVAAEANGKAATTMGVRRVWTGFIVDLLGAPSPDGQYLSCVDRETGDLTILSRTGEKRRLTHKSSGSLESALNSRFSPDGKLIAYAWFNQDGFYDLRIIGADGSRPRVLYRNEEVVYLEPHEWSPDGKRIVARFTRRGKTSQIALVSVVDGSARILKSLDWQYPGKISFSPDGQYIAYDLRLQPDSPNRDIFLLSTDASRETPLVKHPADDAVLGWAPDGKRILFASNRAGTTDAWMIQVADGKPQGSPELVKPDIGQIVPMGFGRNGAYYYGLEIGMGDVHLAELDWATGKLLSPPRLVSERFVGYNKTPDWSPDGQYLAYSLRDRSGAAGSDKLAIQSVATGEVRELSPKLKYIRWLRWSPDGNSLLARAVSEKNRWGIYSINANTGAVTTMVQSQSNGYQAAWSPDGKILFYADQSRIVGRDLESGQDKELAQAPDFRHSLSLSPDGRKLAFATDERQARAVVVKVMPAVGGEARELFRVQEPDSIPSAGLSWTPDGRHVLVIKSRKQTSELWRVSVEGGNAQKLGLAMEGLRDLRFHPNGRRIAFAVEHRKAEVWVMENFLQAAQNRKSSVTKR